MTDMLFCDDHQVNKPLGYNRDRGYLPSSMCPSCLAERVAELQKGNPDDIRELGWAGPCTTTTACAGCRTRSGCSPKTAGQSKGRG